MACRHFQSWDIWVTGMSFLTVLISRFVHRTTHFGLVTTCPKFDIALLSMEGILGWSFHPGGLGCHLQDGSYVLFLGWLTHLFLAN